MAFPRWLPDGCASATSLVVQNPARTLTVVETCMAQLGSVDVNDLALQCSVEHPDGLHCVCRAEVFRFTSGECLLDMTRLRGDSLLFSLVFRLLRTYLETGRGARLFHGQLLPRCRRGPANDPATVPFLELPPAF